MPTKKTGRMTRKSTMGSEKKEGAVKSKPTTRATITPKRGARRTKKAR